MLGELDDILRGGVGGGDDGGDYTGAASSAALEVFVADGNRFYALAFGPHAIKGHLLYYKYVASQPPVSIFGVGIMKGLCEGPLFVGYAGQELDLSPDDVTPGYHFHPGAGSSGFADVDQGRDSFTTDGLTYSGIANIFVMLPLNMAVEERPDKFHTYFQCLKVPDYNINGYESTQGAFTYSTNPARVLAWGAHKANLLHRICWPCWVAWRECSDVVLTYEGDPIPRFEACPAWTRRVEFDELLDTVTFLSGTVWQDDGRLIHFKLPTDQSVSHHFDVSDNIVPNTFQALPDRLSGRVNRLVVSSRDVQSDVIAPFEFPIELPEDILRYGPIVQNLALANMTQSQAWRLGKMALRLSSEYPNKYEFQGFGDSFHLLRGDYVTITNPEYDMKDQLCRIEAVRTYSLKAGADRQKFTVRRIDGVLYRDDDQQPRQPEVEPE